MNEGKEMYTSLNFLGIKSKLALTKEEVNKIHINIYPEETPVRGNCIDSEEDTILYRLSHNDVWAWCRIVVTVNWKGFEGKDSLGCCSYKDLDDFESDGYYNDMVFEALDELNCNITDYYIKLTERYNEKTKG